MISQLLMEMDQIQQKQQQVNHKNEKKFSHGTSRERRKETRNSSVRWIGIDVQDVQDAEDVENVQVGCWMPSMASDGALCFCP